MASAVVATTPNTPMPSARALRALRAKERLHASDNQRFMDEMLSSEEGRFVMTTAAFEFEDRPGVWYVNGTATGVLEDGTAVLIETRGVPGTPNHINVMIGDLSKVKATMTYGVGRCGKYGNIEIWLMVNDHEDLRRRVRLVAATAYRVGLSPTIIARMCLRAIMRAPDAVRAFAYVPKPPAPAPVPVTDTIEESVAKLPVELSEIIWKRVIRNDLEERRTRNVVMSKVAVMLRAALEGRTTSSFNVCFEGKEKWDFEAHVYGFTTNLVADRSGVVVDMDRFGHRVSLGARAGMSKAHVRKVMGTACKMIVGFHMHFLRDMPAADARVTVEGRMIDVTNAIVG